MDEPPCRTGTPGGPLTLADLGSFLVNGRVAQSDHVAFDDAGRPQRGRYSRNQIYVQYLIPAAIRGMPIVLVPGAYHNATAYETTPDGREGWATWFVRQGYPVYLVDQAGRGRSGFDATPLNRARFDAAALPAAGIPQPAIEAGWISYRLGPRYPEFWPGSQFPAGALEHYMAQLVPLSENLLDGGTGNTVDGLETLLAMIGPATVLVHSQSGGFGLDLVRRRANLRNLVIIEGNCVPVAEDEIEAFSAVALLAVWGDRTCGAPGRNGDERRDGCLGTAGRLAEAGADATFLLLPDHGIGGNSHLMMMERNNLQIAALIRDWLRGEGRVTGRSRDQR